MLWSETPRQGVREGRSAYWNVEQWRGQSTSFVDLAVFDPVSATLAGPEGAEKISVNRVSANLFPLLGVSAYQGRLFSAEEAEQRQRLALISYRFWQTRFGGSRSAIGSFVQIDGQPSQIIGVIPETGRFPVGDTDVWEPHTLFPDWTARRVARGLGSWFVVGRLRPNVALGQAQDEMNAITAGLNQQLPAAERNRGVTVVPLSVQIAGPRVRLTLWMLTGAVLCVLLIAATNVASLSLARATSRTREFAVRASLGASRGRIARQLLAENLVLAGMAGLSGLLLASAGIRFILTLAPANLAGLREAGLNPVVLGWSSSLCLLTGILVGLAPAITLARRDLRPSFQEGGRSVAGGVAARGSRRALVAVELTLAVVLLVGAGLLVRSLWSLHDVALGFQPEGRLSVQLAAPVSLPGGQRASFYERVLDSVRSLPGVDSAAVIGDLFIGGNPEQLVSTEGGQASERIRLRRDEVSNDLFQTLGAPLLAGRVFSFADGSDSPPVVIVNQTMARRLWPGRDPLGKRFKFGAADSPRPWFTVVGVAGDMRRQGPENELIPQMFEPLAQNPSARATLLVRTSMADPLPILGPVREAVRRVDKNTPVYDAATLENRLGAFLTLRRFQTVLLIVFSTVALVMAAVGIYGLVKYSVTIRVQEIGIRMAVGAQAGDVLRLIMAEGLKLSLAGLVIGLLGALALGRAVSSLLFGVTAADPLTFVAVSLLLAAVASAACYFPARRAMKIAPTEALRQE
jgi:putative ABC transport system permease protein